jgi:DHA2 family multidrug resistance protein
MVTSLASLEIGVKEAPQRGWDLERRARPPGNRRSWRHRLCEITLGATHPVVDLRLFGTRNFAVAIGALSFASASGCIGSTYLMPFFLAFVRNHSAFEIGTIMLVTGVAQLWRRRSPCSSNGGWRRVLTALGFAIFAPAWPERVSDDARPISMRCSGRKWCGGSNHALPPAPYPAGARASCARQGRRRIGLFNLMRNLGGAIGLALIDTVIFTRGPDYADAIMEKVKADDPATLSLLGLTPEDARPEDPIGFMSISGDIEQLVGDACHQRRLGDAGGHHGCGARGNRPGAAGAPIAP